MCECMHVHIYIYLYGYIHIYPKAPSYLNSRLLRYVTIGYIEPRAHY